MPLTKPEEWVRQAEIVKECHAERAKLWKIDDCPDAPWKSDKRGSKSSATCQHFNICYHLNRKWD